RVVHQLTTRQIARFSVILWFSARDIDLQPSGPKIVRPHLLSIDEFAREFTHLLEPASRATSGFSIDSYFRSELTNSTTGPLLCIFDNFETVKNPAEIFSWIDAYVRAPNKILITT